VPQQSKRGAVTSILHSQITPGLYIRRSRIRSSRMVPDGERHEDRTGSKPVRSPAL